MVDVFIVGSFKAMYVVVSIGEKPIFYQNFSIKRYSRRNPELNENLTNMAKEISKKLYGEGIDSVNITQKGPTCALLKGKIIGELSNYGIQVNWINDVTPVPHNGCMTRKSQKISRV